MSFAAIIANTKAVVVSAGIPEHDYRHLLGEAPVGGADRHFQVAATNITEVTPWLGIQQNRRRAAVTVRVTYFRGGGDAGGASAGGDRYNVNARAVNDMITLSAWLVNPERYDAQNTGINSVVAPEFRRVLDADLFEAWDLTFGGNWEENESSREVA